jgi:NAD(P)-dependent dehydrogenase (short-subunit alcohol dehydrogenase family)
MARIVIVTGGARGLGLAIAHAFRAAGDRVAVGDLDDPPSGFAFAGRLDVRDRASFGRFIDAVRAELGPIDVLVNNAGVASAGEFLDTPSALVDLQLAVNLHGVVQGMELVLPDMVARRSGHVVNVASLAGRVPAPRAAVYTATKFGVLGLTEAVRAEVRRHGVHVTAVLPTFAPTEMTHGLALQGIPKTTPAAVAKAVVRAVDRRRGPVVVPRWLALLPIGASITPRWLRDRLTALAAGSEKRWREALGDRSAYEARVAAQAGSALGSEGGMEHLSDRSG